MKIVVLDGYTLNPGDLSWDEIGKFGELTVYDRTTPNEIVERTRKAEIILTNKAPVSAITLEKLPDLKFITVMATGYDIVDIAAAGRRGIPVSNVPEYGTGLRCPVRLCPPPGTLPSCWSSSGGRAIW